MNREQLTTVLVALACFTAVGAAASSLGSALSSDPQDAVDPDYELLPVDRGDVADLQQEIQSNDETAAETSESSGDGGAGETERDGTTEKQESSSGSADDAEAADGGSDAGSSGSVSGFNLSFGPEGLFSALSTLFWLAALGVGLAVATRYRHRVRALVAALGDDSGGRQPRGYVGQPRRDENVVFATWYALVRSLDVENPYARTTGECADAATEAGMDPDAVRTLRRNFEEVRYGQRPVTSRHREQVREVRSRLDLDGGEELL